jgi:nitrogen fixation protein FixH
MRDTSMNQDSDYQPKGPPLTGRKVLVMLLAFFGVMFGVNFYMAREAIKTHPGLDRANPYDQGVAYNKEIAAAKAQEALGWSVDLTRAQKGGATEVTATVKDKAGRLVSDLQATLHFEYPATSKRDRDVVASAVAEGVYSGEAELAPGHWDVVIEFTREGERLFRSRNAFNVE